MLTASWRPVAHRSARCWAGADAVAALDDAVAAGATGHGSPFHTAAWLVAAAHHLVVPGELRVWRWDDEHGRVGGAWPLAASGGALRSAVSRLADVQGPACRPETRAAAVSALAEAVVAELPPGGADLPALPPDVATAVGRPTAASAAGERTTTIATTGSWEDYLDGPSARRRRRIARSAERLLAGPRARVEHADTAATVGAGLDVLVWLHALRFAERSRQFAGPRLDFFRDVVAALPDGAVHLRTLWLGDRPAAAILLWRHDRGWWFYQSGWDPTLAAASPGRTLFADTVRDAFTRADVDHLHLLRGDEPYKAWWATGPAFTVVDVAVAGRGAGSCG